MKYGPKIWVKAVALAERCGVTGAALRSRRHCILPRQLDESSVVEASVGRSTDAPIEEYWTDVYYTTLDAMMHKMNERFSELNLSLLKALDTLIPNSDLLIFQLYNPFFHSMTFVKQQQRQKYQLQRPFLKRKNRSLKSFYIVYIITFRRFQRVFQPSYNATR